MPWNRGLESVAPEFSGGLPLAPMRRGSRVRIGLLIPSSSGLISRDSPLT